MEVNLMIKFIFDANVLWDLDKINMLEKIMHVLNNVDFRIYMSRINYIEMPIIVRNKLKDYNFFTIEEPNENEYNEFRKEIRQKGIILDNKDSAVLYVCEKINANYIVSSDTKVNLASKKYATKYNTDTRPFHILDFLKLLHKGNLIESKLCINMALNLYKHKELPYMIENFGSELISNKTKRQNWIQTEKTSSLNTFNNYEQHIMIHLR